VVTFGCPVHLEPTATLRIAYISAFTHCPSVGSDAGVGRQCLVVVTDFNVVRLAVGPIDVEVWGHGNRAGRPRRDLEVVKRCQCAGRVKAAWKLVSSRTISAISISPRW